MPEGALGGIVLAGGGARRLRGADKPMLLVGGRPLLRRALDALADCERVVVVGPPREGITGVLWRQEDPPGGGPVAALAAGMAALPDVDVLAVLAGDLPGVTPATVRRLLSELECAEGAAGAVLVDAAGRRQWLTGVWRAAALLAALPPDPAAASLRASLSSLPVVEVAEVAGEGQDVDTPEDLARARDDAPEGFPNAR